MTRQLTVQVPGAQKTLAIAPDKNLARELGFHRIELDVRCGGKNLCNRCRIELRKGIFRVAGRIVDATQTGPVEVNACVAFLESEDGEIAIHAGALHAAAGHVVTEYNLPLRLPAAPGLRAAIDLGTTTVAAMLIQDGQIIGGAGRPNRQFRFGDNVASRISAAADPAAADEMRRAVVLETLEPLLMELTGEPEKITRIAVAGNTVMTHLLYGYSPESIGTSPFIPAHYTFPDRPAAEFGFTRLPNATLSAAPAISGYVGGDLTAGLEAAKFFNGEETALFVDLGTNCEIVLRKEGKFYATAAAAGPAFEGANLSCGGRAAPGAADHLKLDRLGRFRGSVLGGLAQPASLCGSAMVDFLALARKAGFLSEFGRLDCDMLRARGMLVENGSIRACRIFGDLVMTEPDIEQLLKAKAAVAAGIAALLRHCNVKGTPPLYLAGGFARHLHLPNAQAIGLLPPGPPEHFHLLGNTSLAGAALLALDPAFAVKMEKNRKRPEEISLNLLPGFEDDFIDHLLLQEE